MQASFVQGHIRRGNRNLLIWGAALTIIGVGLAALFAHWFPLLVALPGVVMLGFWMLRIVNPNTHPIYKQLAHYGDPHQIALAVDQEFADTKAGEEAYFGRTYLASGHLFGLDIVAWQDIAWLYIYTRIRNRVPMTYIRVLSRDGKQFIVPTFSETERAEQFLRQLQARAPWADVGYSSELETQWNRQRAEFIKRVDTRKGVVNTGGSGVLS